MISRLPRSVSVLLFVVGACGIDPTHDTDCTGGSSTACAEIVAGANLLDADTATLERGTGHWSAWYGAAIARTTSVAHTGSASLAITASGDQFGVDLDDYPGFAVTGHPDTIAYASRASTGGIALSFAVSWLDASGATLRTDTLASTPTTSWTQVSRTVTAPTGAARAWIEIRGSHAPGGARVDLDDVFVGTATRATDAGTSHDAAMGNDARATDAGTSHDAAMSVDATAPHDAATPPTDSGVIPTDAGVPPTDGSYPTTPPAIVCDQPSVLAGPTSAPAGAIVVRTSDDLSTVTQNAPAGSTFYLLAGVHHLAPGQFDQVVPKDNDTFIGAPGAILDGQHSNLYAFTQHAAHVTLRYFTVQNFGTPGSTNNEGTVNHDGADGWTIDHMTIQHNSGAGLFIGSNDVVRYNCLRQNGQYGFSAYSPTGITNVVMDHNEISGNNTDDWETRQPGCGCTGGGKFWATRGATVTNNYVHDNLSVGLWADTNNVGFDFSGNYIAGNSGVGIMYEISYNARIANNTFVRNGLVDGPGNPGFPTGAVYLSESGGDARVASAFSSIEVSGNDFVDNWSGVVLWENADRYCNSPANTSSDVCTLGGAATLSRCVAGTIASAPYYSDCRWKTQHVHVHDNVFSITPSHIGSRCTTANSCGQQGVFSNWGSYPSWSPYMGSTIEDQITSHQDNVFSHNQYIGPWTFVAHDQGVVLTAATWQAAPYGQDVGSTFH